MKKVIISIAIVLAGNLCFGQELFLVFDFMKVEDEHIMAYLENEGLWEKIHKQGIADGAYTGWDLWQLRPGGMDQGYQYLTVTIYDSKSAMMKGSSVEQILDRGQRAYPDMDMNALQKKFTEGIGTRTRGMAVFLELIDGTEQEFDMPLGTYMTMTMMKQLDDGYEKAESEIFKPLHQIAVNEGAEASWDLARFVIPQGSAAKASHFTIQMYKDVDQYVTMQDFDWQQYVEDWDAVNKGLETRDLKWVYHGVLMKKVR